METRTAKPPPPEWGGVFPLGGRVKKYEFTGVTKNYYGVTLRQIRALITIAGVVTAGDAGGWIAEEKNLDHAGNAWISGDAQISGDARISGNAWISGNAQISGDADWCSFSSFGSEYRTTTAYIDKELGIRIDCGCFTGSLYQFRQKVINRHGEDSKNGKLYLGMANMIEFRLEFPASFEIKEAA